MDTNSYKQTLRAVLEDDITSGDSYIDKRLPVISAENRVQQVYYTSSADNFAGHYDVDVDLQEAQVTSDFRGFNEDVVGLRHTRTDSTVTRDTFAVNSYINFFSTEQFPALKDGSYWSFEIQWGFDARVDRDEAGFRPIASQEVMQKGVFTIDVSALLINAIVSTVEHRSASTYGAYFMTRIFGKVLKAVDPEIIITYSCPSSNYGRDKPRVILYCWVDISMFRYQLRLGVRGDTPKYIGPPSG